MRHQDLHLNHRLESWVYADTAARTGAVGFVAGDIGRIAYQSDNGTYWRLIDTAPTWQGAAGVPVTSTIGYHVAGSTMSTVGVMAGIAATLTPTRSGNVFVTINGSFANSSSTGDVQVRLRYGTGSVPANGIALTGTGIGAFASATLPGADIYMPYSCSAIVTGLALSIQIWFDLEQRALTTGTATVQYCVSAFELP